MSNVYNRTLKFDDPLPHVAFSTPYVDPSGNQWRVDVSGLPDTVRYFIERKPLKLEAVPLTADQYFELLKEMTSKPSLSPAERARPVFVSSTGAEAQQTPEQELEQAKGADASTSPDLATAGPPAFVLTLTLLALQVRGPHRLIFELDPPIAHNTSPQAVYFTLWGSDYTPDVSCSSLQGSVWYTLSGGGQNWAVYIYWSSGAPAYYVLRGDVVRN